MVVSAVAVHPIESVTVTEYVVPVTGETVITDVVAPVLQKYESPPPAVSVVLLPRQIVSPGLMVALAVFTVTATLALAEQLLFETVTV